MKLTLDPDALTFGDMEDFESFTGQPLMDTFTKIGDDGRISGLGAKAVLGIIWVCGRASNPEFTLDDARKVRVSEIEVEVGSPDPTPDGA